MKNTIFVMLLIVSFTLNAQRGSSENIILISVDGLRWQEVFQGPDSTLNKDKQFSAATIQQRRERLMPFFWSTIASEGQLYGNRDFGNKVNVKNKYWYSYPGRAETLTGYYDPKINSNGYPNNPNENVLEFFNNMDAYKDKVVTFASWNALGNILNRDRNGMLVNLPGENVKEESLTEAQILANEIQHYLPVLFGDTRPDAHTFALAKAYMLANHPKILHIDFADPDNYGHSGKYGNYLESAHYIDAMVGNLWKTIQNDPFYKDNTAILVYPDHGRGINDEWTGHGSGATRSDETWLVAIGPDIKPLGEVKTEMQIYQDETAQTVANLLGFTFKANHPIGNSINSILK